MAAKDGKGINKQKAARQKKNQGRRLARRNAMVVERNKERRILAHLKRHPWDAGALKNLAALKAKMLGLSALPPSKMADLPKLTESPRQRRAKIGITLTQEKEQSRNVRRTIAADRGRAEAEAI